MNQKSNVWVITFAIITTAVVVGGGVFVWQSSNLKSTEQNLQQQIIILQNQIRKLRQIPKESSVNQIQNANKADAGNEIETVAGWQTYQNEELDITFDYPPTWQPQKITNREDGSFHLNFKATELDPGYEGMNHLYIVGINNKYINAGTPKWFGYCAVRYKSLDEFCRSGCEKINENVAIDYRYVGHGDLGFSAIIYTNLSQKYPSICFEFDLSQILVEISAEKGIDYYELPENCDIESIIKNRKLSDSLIQAVDNFENFAKTIKLK